MSEYTGKKWFAICRGDVGSKAYRDEYVVWLQAEIKRLRDNIRYWSYCTSQGMRDECPAKVEDLANFLISLGIAPYYMQNTCCETVRTADDDSEMDQRLTDRDME